MLGCFFSALLYQMVLYIPYGNVEKVRGVDALIHHAKESIEYALVGSIAVIPLIALYGLPGLLLLQKMDKANLANCLLLVLLPSIAFAVATKDISTTLFYAIPAFGTAIGAWVGFTTRTFRRSA